MLAELALRVLLLEPARVATRQSLLVDEAAVARARVRFSALRRLFSVPKDYCLLHLAQTL